MESKVFQENFRNGEFSTITPDSASGTIFLDTINSHTITDSTYHTVLAADTSIIALPKLVLYPPVVPAIKDDTLVPKSSKPYTIHKKSAKDKQAFENINVTLDKEKKTATITWELKDPKAIKELIVYKGPSKEEISRWKIIDPSQKSIKLDNLNKTETIFLYISPVSEEGNLSKFSDLIIVEF